MNRPLFALRRGAFLSLSLTLVLGVGLAACSGETATSSAPAATSSAAASDDGAAGGLEITAADLLFSTDTLTAPAGEDFVVTFTNNDTVPHNFSVYTEEGGDAIVTGDIINEGETDEVEVSALEPGTYFFMCDLHPEMNGTLVVEG